MCVGGGGVDFATSGLVSQCIIHRSYEMVRIKFSRVSHHRNNMKLTNKISFM